MKIIDIILIIIILLALGSAVLHIYRAKKRGQHCVGCPYSGKCNKCGSRTFQAFEKTPHKDI